MPLYAPGSGPHKTTHENAGSDEIDATGLTGAGGGGGGWETESTDATKLETGRQRIWDENLDASIVLDGSITLIGGTGWGIEAEMDTGEVFEVGGDGIVVAVLASEPATGIDGQIYYNSATDKFRTRVNGAWQDMTAAAGAHNTTHQNGGADEISIAGLDGTPVELTNHIADATDAHDASAVSFDDTGLTITAADVQTMGEQLDAAISAGGIPSTIVDAKGDSIVGTAADTVAREAVGADGTILVAASGETTGRKWSYPPGYELDYVEFTSNVNITATTSAGSDVIVTAGSVTFDGAAVWVETQASYWNCPAGNSLIIVLWDNTAGAALGTLAQMTNNDVDIARFPGSLKRRFTPAAGARVLSIRGFVGSAATGVVGAGAGGAGVLLPGYIRITKV